MLCGGTRNVELVGRMKGGIEGTSVTNHGCLSMEVAVTKLWCKVLANNSSVRVNFHTTLGLKLSRVYFGRAGKEH